MHRQADDDAPVADSPAGHLNYHLGQVDYLGSRQERAAIDLAGCRMRVGGPYVLSTPCLRRSCPLARHARLCPARKRRQLSFPTSGSAEAQRHFLRGVAILHSFGWKQAIAEFQLAQKAQPDFAMAYWGESLCYNHPLNSQMDFKEPRAVLARLGPDRAARVAKAPTASREGLPERGRGAVGRGRLAAAPHRLHERDGAALQAVPQ